MKIVADCLYEIIKKDFHSEYTVVNDSITRNQISNVQPFEKNKQELTDTDSDKSLDGYLSLLKAMRYHKKNDLVGSIVVNCNPFTNGHKFLVEQSLKECDFLYIFVLEEDKSAFKFKDRIELVREGIKDLKNVCVLPSGNFIISSITFPEYFVKDAKSDIVIDATEDVEIFANQIAPILNIHKRFAGEEPLCNITRQYNSFMKDILPKYGLEFKVFKRLEMHGEVVSASRIRKLIKTNDLDKIKPLVPVATYEFIIKNREGILH